ncbi:MAG: acetyl-CoA carboxylase biotin carboxylase subunit, partial [Planctomycetota bacterium]|nr:acetyl-CoA carboxylase biotin carboxylase subunit [Planctomycetota bacterium]
MFRRILVANRGEIALRVIRAAHELGIEAVAVFSQADRGGTWLQAADEAICIGPAESAQSYLDIARIMAAAEVADVEAIHPGYGFLAENSDFAGACEDAGITFIGPAPKSIALMGSKIESRRAVSRYGVSMIPGTMDPVTSDGEALQAAGEIGFPVMIKASAGGGGKGLRFV